MTELEAIGGGITSEIKLRESLVVMDSEFSGRIEVVSSCKFCIAVAATVLFVGEEVNVNSGRIYYYV